MDVVGDATNGDRVSAYVLYYTTDVREDLWQVFLPYGYSCAFRVEDDVEV